MKLVQVRACDGECCREAPRWPTEDRSSCVFLRDDAQCRLMTGEAEVPETCPALPDMTGYDAFVFSCRQWPHNTRPRKGKTGECCWQWVD